MFYMFWRESQELGRAELALVIFAQTLHTHAKETLRSVDLNHCRTYLRQGTDDWRVVLSSV